MKTNEEYRLLEQQLSESQKQIVMLREALETSDQLLRGLPNSGGLYGLAVMDGNEEALAATADLSGLILCNAEPRSYLYSHNSAFGDGAIWSHRPLHNGQDALESLPLYQAKERK